MAQRKKDPTTRARANRSSTAATLAANVTSLPAPKLPQRRGPDGRIMKWRAETVEWWQDLWASPMAAEYHSSDRHALYLLAVLMDKFWTEPSQQLAAEIRLQRQAFGLTPYDRLRLEWTFETADEAKDRGKARRSRSTASEQPKPAVDPRLVLVQ